MPKKLQNGPNQLTTATETNRLENTVNSKEIPLLTTIIGALNVDRWVKLKEAFLCENNTAFVTKLLDIAQEYLIKNPIIDNASKNDPQTIKSKIKKKSKLNKNDIKEKPVKSNNEIKNGDEKVKIETVTSTTTICPAKSDTTENKSDSLKINNNEIKKEDANLKNEKSKTKLKNSKNAKREKENDIRKAPQLDTQVNEQIAKLEIKSNNSSPSKYCSTCNTRHVSDKCPIHNPQILINDAISQSDWIRNHKESYDNDVISDNETDSNRQTQSNSYSRLSLPKLLKFQESTDTQHGLGVFARSDVKRFAQFGPLMGKIVKEVDIPEDFNMRDLWEIQTDKGNVYINTEDEEISNWIRFVRPAPTRDEKNLMAVIRDNSLFLVSVKAISKGEELLYWQDNLMCSFKKKLEKNSCGGCNMTFAHPIYYRTHCSVFHDVRYSLTIRKYHCKVCGSAVLGKENIMKHAAELHNGQGAYQCQFCKKFFLRLNYLEMHRTYGCSANPHRSRPLCDFCGRKFCQPQKLKVHIKRMHSDFSEVLKEFQCKKCLKILGSRAALQRHFKEVHQKQVDGACSCTRCGKHFQNKSNLKIHMLTHSGIKPFKCSTDNCNAAFTTKQCLQFHYKKVHNFTEDNMPKIERSVDYTFQAYSGADDDDKKQDSEDLSNEKQIDQSDVYDEDASDTDSFDAKSIDDPPALQSPLEVEEEPPLIDSYEQHQPMNNMKILSKGSKKWIGDSFPITKQSDIYSIERLSKEDIAPESDIYDRNKLAIDFNGRQDASNASLLVEAALDSVCSEPNIEIDVNSSQNCTDSLVNNLYTLAQPENLQEVSYNDINESRDINLISPSVNDHISVTDDLNDELKHNSMNMDYSNFQHEDFSPANSPSAMQRFNIRSYNELSPHGSYQKSSSPGQSPPRYDFGHNNDHHHSDESNGVMAAQNLSLAKNDMQMDLTMYKSYQYSPPRKDLRKIDICDRSDDREQLDVDGVGNANDMIQVEFNSMEVEEKNENENHDRPNKYADDLSTDIRNKFELDLDFRLKNYEIEVDTLRQRSYENDLDFRKSYDMIDGMESRKVYDNIEVPTAEPFRDRNFEPLVLNSDHGLDMSARSSFHNYSNINRYHLYSEVDRMDLRLNYSPPPPISSTYSHADILRVVSLDLTPPGRHNSVDLSLRTHPLHQIANSRLLGEHPMHQSNPHRLLDQSRLLTSDLTNRIGESRLLTESTGRILSDHTTNRILGNDQISTNHLLNEPGRLLTEEARILPDPPRLLDQTRLIGDGRILASTTPSGPVSPVPAFTGYSVTQTPYHPTPLAPRPHVTSPTPTPYHPYSPYY